MMDLTEKGEIYRNSVKIENLKDALMQKLLRLINVKTQRL